MLDFAAVKRRPSKSRTAVRCAAAIATALVVAVVVGVSGGSAASGHARARAVGGDAWPNVGATGLARRADRTASYAACVDGSLPSSLDLASVMIRPRPVLGFAYASQPVVITIVGPTVQVETGPGSLITVNGGLGSELVEMLVHVPAKSIIAGKRAPVEARLVHRAADGALTVIIMMLRTGPRHNAAWQPMVRALRRASVLGGREAKVTQTTFHWGAMLPKALQGSRFASGQAPAGCADNVSWIVLRRAALLSANQLAAFTAYAASTTKQTDASTGLPAAADDVGSG